jgi:hypothetical protein
MVMNSGMSDQDKIRERLKTAQEECRRLREENVRLRAMLGIDHLPTNDPTSQAALVPKHLSTSTSGVSTPEGFDDPRLDTLLLAMPISWKGTLQQYVGRLHRLHVNKSEVHVYDYADVMVPMLARMYKKRLAGYSALGYTVAEVVRS